MRLLYKLLKKFMSNDPLQALPATPTQVLGAQLGEQTPPRWVKLLIILESIGAVDGARTRDPRRDRPVL